MYTGLGLDQASEMRISQKSEYALAAILDLALQTPGEFVKVAGISQRQQIPLKFLELILAELKQRGFVTSKRGAEGGYRLFKSADSITVGEILTWFGERRARKTRDGLTDLWNRVESLVWGILDNTTFAEIAALGQERRSRSMEQNRLSRPDVTNLTDGGWIGPSRSNSLRDG